MSKKEDKPRWSHADSAFFLRRLRNNCWASSYSGPPWGIRRSSLLGGRNEWASLLEESWPEIGWHLLQIRKHATRTIAEVRKAFQPVKQKPHNPGLAQAFYRERVEVARPAEVQRNRKRVGELQAEVQHAGAKLNDIQQSIWAVEQALKIVPAEDKNVVQDEIARRRQVFLQLEIDINRLTVERDALDKESLDQETHLYASELLDFFTTLFGASSVVTVRLKFVPAETVAGAVREKWVAARLSPPPPLLL